MRLFLFFTSKTQNIWCVTHYFICLLACSRKNPNRGLRIYFLNPPWDFSLFYFTPWKFHIIFSWSPFGNSILFLSNPWKFHKLFHWYPLEIPYPRKNIAIHQHFLNQLWTSKSFTQISGLRTWCSWGTFVHEMNMKGCI